MKTKIEQLLLMPIWQMTGQDFCDLAQYANAQTHATNEEMIRPMLLTGVQALADYLSCSQSRIFALRRAGVLDAAVVSHLGRRIVFDGAKARELATEYERSMRAQ